MWLALLNLTSDRLLSDLMLFCAAFGMLGTLEFGSFRNLIGFFQPLMFTFVTIMDLKYYLQRDKFPR